MTTIYKLTSAAQAENYFTGHEDYYTNRIAPPGQWSAPNLGLNGLVTREQLRDGLSGIHPVTGERLSPEKSDRVPGWDMVFAAPKSVSALFAIAPAAESAAIEQDVMDSTQVALRFLSEHGGQTRRGHNGKEKETVPLNAALFPHASSRNMDPHLHVHAVILNLAQRADGTWGSIDSPAMYQWAKASGVIFQAELSRRLAVRGYVIEPSDHDTFQIPSVPLSVRESWSSRANEIDHMIDEVGIVGPGARDVAQKRTRAPKRHQTRNSLHTQWQGQAQALEWFPDFSALKSHAPTSPQPTDRPTLFEKLTEHSSTFDLRELYIAVGSGSYGTRDLPSIDNFVSDIQEDPGILRIPSLLPTPRFTTQAMIDMEKQTIDRLKDLKQQHVLSPSPIKALPEDPHLSEEQRAAVRLLTTQSGRLHALTGPAGTGKSRALDGARKIWEASGYHVIGAAIAAKAAGVLQEEAQIRSQTLAHLLTQGGVPHNQPSVLVVDESSMVDTRDFSRLVTLMEAHPHSQLVLVGDADQLPSIGPGGMFRAALGIVEPAQLKTMRRQVDPQARRAARDFVSHDAATALAFFQSAGQLHIDAGSQLMPALIADWMANKTLGSQIIVASTRSQVFHLNRHARIALQQANLLPPDQYRIPTAFGERALSIGDQVILRKNDYRHLAVRNGDRGIVTNLQMTPSGALKMTITRSDGRPVTFDPLQYPHWDWAYATTLHQSQGQTCDRVYWLVSNADTAAHAYVAASRARIQTDVYIDRTQWEGLDRTATATQSLLRVAEKLDRSGDKTLAMDELYSLHR